MVPLPVMAPEHREMAATINPTIKLNPQEEDGVAFIEVVLCESCTINARSEIDAHRENNDMQIAIASSLQRETEGDPDMTAALAESMKTWYAENRWKTDDESVGVSTVGAPEHAPEAPGT